MRRDGIRTVFLVWSPTKRTSSKKHELARFSLTEMNDYDGTTGNRKAPDDANQDT
jgi:hypothetical protein